MIAPQRIALTGLGILLAGTAAVADDLILLRFAEPAPTRLILLEDSAAVPPPADSVTAPPAETASAGDTVAEPIPLRVELALGLRQDNLIWSIGIPGSGPNVLSELDWQRVRLTTLTAAIEQPLSPQLWMKGWLGAGKVWQGDNRDSDWLEDNRSNEFSRSYQETPGHSAFDAGLEMSWRLHFDAAHTHYLAPQLGYTWSSLFLNLRDGVRVIAPVFDANGDVVGGTPVNEPIPGLDSTYEAIWSGPYLGLAGHWQISPTLSLGGGVQRHFTRYRGEGNWNLRSEFSHPASFEHSGDGGGWRAGIELAWQYDTQLAYVARFDASRFSLQNGVDQTNFSDGSQSSIRLNEVEWDSATLFLGLQYTW
jgi:outer membrane protease